MAVGSWTRRLCGRRMRLRVASNVDLGDLDWPHVSHKIVLRDWISLVKMCDLWNVSCQERGSNVRSCVTYFGIGWEVLISLPKLNKYLAYMCRSMPNTNTKIWTWKTKLRITIFCARVWNVQCCNSIKLCHTVVCLIWYWRNSSCWFLIHFVESDFKCSTNLQEQKFGLTLLFWLW